MQKSDCHRDSSKKENLTSLLCWKVSKVDLILHFRSNNVYSCSTRRFFNILILVMDVEMQGENGKEKMKREMDSTSTFSSRIWILKVYMLEKLLFCCSWQCREKPIVPTACVHRSLSLSFATVFILLEKFSCERERKWSRFFWIMERSDDEEMVTPMNFFLGILCAWACAFTGVAHVDEHVHECITCWCTCRCTCSCWSVHFLLKTYFPLLRLPLKWWCKF